MECELCRVGASGQGSPLRGIPAQGIFNSPNGSPSASASFSPRAPAEAEASSASLGSSAQSSSPERGYSAQLSQLSRGEALGEGSPAAARVPSDALDQSGTAAISPRTRFAQATEATEDSQEADRIAAVRPDDALQAAASQAEAATADAGSAVSHSTLLPKARKKSLLQSNLTRRSSVADRLKSVRGMLAAADSSGAEDIAEDLPLPVVAANDNMVADENIAEEPQLVATGD